MHQESNHTLEPNRIRSYFRLEWLPLAFVTLYLVISNVSVLSISHRVYESLGGRTIEIR